METIKEYYRKSRSEMLSYLPAELRVLLDIGCGCGGFGALIKEQHRLEAEVWGIEYDEMAANDARKVLDKVINVSIEDAMKELPLNHFDCVIFNDSLEHMADPFSVLKGIKPYITKMELSLPQFQISDIGRNSLILLLEENGGIAIKVCSIGRICGFLLKQVLQRHSLSADIVYPCLRVSIPIILTHKN